MKTSVFASLCLGFVFIAATRAVAAEPPASMSTADPAAAIDLQLSDLKRDTRLQKTLTERVTCLSLRQLCRELSETSGATIDCDERLSVQKIQMNVRERPTYAVMASLAELLSGTWSNGVKGYRLRQTTEAVAYRDRWWKLFLAEREKAKRHMAEEYLLRMDQPPPPRIRMTEITGDDAYNEVVKRSLFWHTLPRDIRRNVIDSISDIDSYRRSTSFLSGTRDGGYAIPLDRLPKECQQPLFEQTVAFNSLSADRLANEARGVEFRSLATEIRAGIVRANGSTVAPGGFMVGLAPYEDPLIRYLDHNWLPDAVEKLGEKAPPVWKTLAEYQTKTVWPNETRPEGPPQMDAGVASRMQRWQKQLPAERNSEETQDRMAWFSAAPWKMTPTKGSNESQTPKVRRADILNKIADQGGEYISDYYSLAERPMSSEERRAKSPEALEAQMDHLVATHDVSWKKSEGILLVRNNRWYRDDYLEAPLASELLLKSRLMSSAAAPFGKPASATEAEHLLKTHLDLARDIASSFSLWQIANGLKYFIDEPVYETKFARASAPATFRTSGAFSQPLADIVETALCYPKLCAFYASLSDPERWQFIDEGLPVDRLTPTQHQLLEQAYPQAAFLTVSGRKVCCKVDNLVVRGRVAGVFDSPAMGCLTYYLRLSLEEPDDARNSGNAPSPIK